MTIFDIFAIVLLAVLLFWTLYNGSIIYIGIRSKRKVVPKSEAKENREFPKFSIIVPTKDEEAVISRCLNGIMNLDYPKDKFEIIVVDGNSKDATCKISEEFSTRYPENIKVISEEESKGKPAALNLSLSYATGDIVGVFDADSLPERDALKKVASYFDDEKVTAVQGRTTSLNEKKNVLTRVVSMEEKAWFQALLTG
jgi:cellulose synthase/poly-beta-1,6-N-acetylglucosamine synthase-like glycosyltransferase